jgi:hypothetical protein
MSLSKSNILTNPQSHLVLAAVFLSLSSVERRYKCIATPGWHQPCSTLKQAQTLHTNCMERAKGTPSVLAFCCFGQGLWPPVASVTPAAELATA